MGEERVEPYRAYLLRCWQEKVTSPTEKPAWRFSIEDILGERQRQGFSRLEELVTFLRTELADNKDEPPANDD